MSWTRLLRRDRRGISALEFALCLPVLLALTGGVADYGLLWDARGDVTAAVNAGVQDALLAGTAATKSGVQTVMGAASNLSSATYTATAPACECVNTSGTTVTLASQTCGVTCANGTAPGTFMTLTGTYSYKPIMPNYGHLATTQVSVTATVRLQ
jgi:Flp pilus assembly protein TadG